ncbi:antibiotic biosynthesis monooxygenase [Candidatus Saccharibacteria bacterium]|nr:antibiotic biosynthesis monooxygenase [Candidatus Saccharibacteria bacterium]
MVVTILEARVDEGEWDLLRNTYKTLTQEVPPEIKGSYLMQDQKDKDVWRIVTLWKSQAALTAMRQSGEIPTGIVIFNKVGASPELSVHKVEDAAPKYS